jgi:hypothetical protein
MGCMNRGSNCSRANGFSVLQNIQNNCAAHSASYLEIPPQAISSWGNKLTIHLI